VDDRTLNQILNATGDAEVTAIGEMLKKIIQAAVDDFAKREAITSDRELMTFFKKLGTLVEVINDHRRAYQENRFPTPKAEEHFRFLKQTLIREGLRVIP
jgi:hypothetical protein